MGFPDFGSRFNSLGKAASWSHSFVFFGSGNGGQLWDMNFRGFGSRFNSLGKTASWSHSFVFVGSGKVDQFWAMNFPGFGLRFNSLRKTASWSHSFVFFGFGKGTTLGYEFSRLWIEIQFVTKSGLLEPFFCLLRLWQG